MPIRIQIDPNKVGAKVMGAWKESLLPLSSQILEDCNQYVKVDQHTMESSSYAASDLNNGKLVWDTPYAKRQYWEIRRAIVPGRTWKWCETAKRKHKADWQKLAERLLRSKL
ncbi:MAG: hypothetical protein IJ896_00245 [Fibrobacter sp.]|nr:hypothetical protein [Fibrobacter sp.]